MNRALVVSAAAAALITSGCGLAHDGGAPRADRTGNVSAETSARATIAAPTPSAVRTGAVGPGAAGPDAVTTSAPDGRGALPPVGVPAGAAAGTAAAGVRPGARAEALDRVLAAAPLRVLYVAPGGSDSAPGSRSAPLRSVQRAVDLATPGTVIRLRAGTYTGRVTIRRSGTKEHPIVLTAAAGEAVVLTSSPAPVACDSSRPAGERTIMVGGGADHWRIAGLTIRHGIYISGRGVNTAFRHFTDLVESGNWQARRAIPGRSSHDPAAATGAVAHVAAATGSALDPSDGIHVVGNEITGRGVHAAMSRYGVVRGNRIHTIDCGTGPGLWLVTLSDGWKVTDNTVHDVRASSYKHYMQEGIRLGSSSNYNLVAHNLVSGLSGDGRAFNTDVDASFNIIRRNVAEDVATGYNEQMSGWGNTWEGNFVRGYRVYGFGFRLMDGSLTKPSPDTSSNGPKVRCNVAQAAAGGKALGVGGISNADFTGNGFDSTWISRNSRQYWASAGNRWNGQAVAPEVNPRPADTSAC